jgi:ABC-type Fe3+ transport system substrate-binding protein
VLGNDAVVRYVLGDENQQIFASRYKMQLPSEEDLRLELKRERRQIHDTMKIVEASV